MLTRFTDSVALTHHKKLGEGLLKPQSGEPRYCLKTKKSWNAVFLTAGDDEHWRSLHYFFNFAKLLYNGVPDLGDGGVNPGIYRMLRQRTRIPICLSQNDSFEVEKIEKVKKVRTKYSLQQMCEVP